VLSFFFARSLKRRILVLLQLARPGSHWAPRARVSSWALNSPIERLQLLGQKQALEQELISFCPSAQGFWVPWLPLAIRQSWPFAWALLVVLDSYSRRALAVRVFLHGPSSLKIQQLLEDLIVSLDQTPKYIISDQGVQFREQYREWCELWKIKPRFGAIGQHGSIALVERFILTLKMEGLRRLLTIPLQIDVMQEEVDCFLHWYNHHRPHQALGGVTPFERYAGLPPARDGPRFEPRGRVPLTSKPSSSAPVEVRGERGGRLELVVSQLEGRAHLPIVELRSAA
jgi:transposase InsO family protein